MTVRLRQVALVAHSLDPVVPQLCADLGIEVGFNDPGIDEFGLVNAVMPVGNTFLEVVAPDRDGTTAGRLLAKRGGDGGYMVILQYDDLDSARARVDALGVRVVWRHDARAAKGTHLHPRDTGGAILSLDWMDGWDEWVWAGPRWRDHVRAGVTTGIAAVELQAPDPAAMAARWSEVIGAPLDAAGTTVLLDEGAIRFVGDLDGRGEGVSGIDVTAADRSKAGTTIERCGTRVRFV